MIHSAVNIRETQNSTSSAYYSIHVYNVVPTNNFFLYALIDIPMHVFVAVFIVITPRLHNSQNNFLFYDFVEREKRWRTVFRRHNKNLFPFPWNQRGYKNWLERGAALLPCAHNENKFAFLFFSVCAISVTLSLSPCFPPRDTKLVLQIFCQKDGGPKTGNSSHFNSKSYRPSAVKRFVIETQIFVIIIIVNNFKS